MILDYDDAVIRVAQAMSIVSITRYQNYREAAEALLKELNEEQDVVLVSGEEYHNCVRSL